jgi:hypoxanthine phosphoribosyltransferase
MIFRELTDEDLPQVENLLRETFGINFPYEVLSYEYYKTFVLEKDKDIIGIIQFWNLLGEADITLLAVKRDYRRNGYGKILIEKSLDFLKKNKVDTVYLEVAVDNIPAIKLYEKMGFRPLTIRKGYYSDGRDAIIMKKNLRSEALEIRGRKLELLISEDEIKKKVVELANLINEDFKGEELYVIGILKGSFMFFADLVRNLKGKVFVDFMQVSSYKTGMESIGEVVFIKDMSVDIKGKNVLIVDDIIDTGRTLKALVEALSSREPNKLKTAVLLDKKDRREVDYDADYVGFVIPDKFVVGYGLDWAEEGRNLKEIYAVV